MLHVRLPLAAAVELVKRSGADSMSFDVDVIRIYLDIWSYDGLEKKTLVWMHHHGYAGLWRSGMTPVVESQVRVPGIASPASASGCDRQQTVVSRFMSFLRNISNHTGGGSSCSLPRNI
ncbi:hypothetical protein DL546_005426 [Coniochaeta pulveracea]|uniref:Uncharacterized protein n=1 Tax=Coniochaeta pulveracea TaxID=177199 RepID=A0A420YD19_9PEZI|nr:hypothetical protein DL546_005426 [Coniochaeta pulveracea]